MNLPSNHEETEASIRQGVADAKAGRTSPGGDFTQYLTVEERASANEALTARIEANRADPSRMVRHPRR